MSDNRPIGVFDSGLGGLTAVKQLAALLPGESIVYFGDTGRIPYGSRGRDTIIKYARQDAAFLLSRGVKLIAAACGTVSSVATGLGDALPVPFINVLQPTTLAAAKATRSKRVGVIGTTATIRSGAYGRALKKLNPSITVCEADCPLLVHLVESGFTTAGEPITTLAVERYLAPLRDARVDTLILGCTHYPLLGGFISAYMGPGVTIIDSGRESALACAALLNERGMAAEPGTRGTRSFFVSDAVEGFIRVADVFLGEHIDPQVTQVDIETYEGV